MKWIKHGPIWAPSGEKVWAKSHATCPTPVSLPDGTLRVFVQSRDAQNVGRVGFVDLDPENPLRVLNEAKDPVLDVGASGCFDDNGVFQTCVFEDAEGILRMYYVGFELSYHIRYRLLSGLAVSSDNGLSFERVREVPVLERSNKERYFRGGPFVRKESNMYRIWYVSGDSWLDLEGKLMPEYHLAYAESANGIDWPAEGVITLPLNQSEEHGFGRPYVCEIENGYEMFYSIRKLQRNGYRMGYAISSNGVNWERRDREIGITPSIRGWDSESVEYGAPFESCGKRWLLYNGNDFGGTGFGIAELVSEG